MADKKNNQANNNQTPQSIKKIESYKDSPDTEKEKNAYKAPTNPAQRAAENRARVANGQPQKEIDNPQWGKKPGTTSNIDEETNKKFAGGKSWKEIVEEQKKANEKGKGKG